MSLSLEATPKRNYLTINNKRLKVIPRPFVDIPIKEIKTALISENTSMILSDLERFNLRYVIYKDFLQKNDPFVYKLIKNLVPFEVREVTVRHQEDKRFELVFNNGYYIKIPHKLYQLHPLKSSKFSNF